MQWVQVALAARPWEEEWQQHLGCLRKLVSPSLQFDCSGDCTVAHPIWQHLEGAHLGTWHVLVYSLAGYWTMADAVTHPTVRNSSAPFLFLGEPCGCNPGLSPALDHLVLELQTQIFPLGSGLSACLRGSGPLELWTIGSSLPRFRQICPTISFLLISPWTYMYTLVLLGPRLVPTRHSAPTPRSSISLPCTWSTKAVSQHGQTTDGCAAQAPFPGGGP